MKTVPMGGVTGPSHDDPTNLLDAVENLLANGDSHSLAFQDTGELATPPAIVQSNEPLVFNNHEVFHHATASGNMMRLLSRTPPDSPPSNPRDHHHHPRDRDMLNHVVQQAEPFWTPNPLTRPSSNVNGADVSSSIASFPPPNPHGNGPLGRSSNPMATQLNGGPVPVALGTWPIHRPPHGMVSPFGETQGQQFLDAMDIELIQDMLDNASVGQPRLGRGRSAFSESELLESMMDFGSTSES
jgi:hypothetical protein